MGTVKLDGVQFVIGKTAGQSDNAGYTVVGTAALLTEGEQNQWEGWTNKFANLGLANPYDFADGLFLAPITPPDGSPYIILVRYGSLIDGSGRRFLQIYVCAIRTESFKSNNICPSWLFLDNYIPQVQLIPQKQTLPSYSVTLDKVDLDRQIGLISTVVERFTLDTLLRIMSMLDDALQNNRSNVHVNILGCPPDQVAEACVALSLLMPPETRLRLSFFTRFIKGCSGASIENSLVRFLFPPYPDNIDENKNNYVVNLELQTVRPPIELTTYAKLLRLLHEQGGVRTMLRPQSKPMPLEVKRVEISEPEPEKPHQKLPLAELPVPERYPESPFVESVDAQHILPNSTGLILVDSSDKAKTPHNSKAIESTGGEDTAVDNTDEDVRKYLEIFQADTKIERIAETIANRQDTESIRDIFARHIEPRDFEYWLEGLRGVDRLAGIILEKLIGAEYPIVIEWNTEVSDARVKFKITRRLYPVAPWCFRYAGTILKDTMLSYSAQMLNHRFPLARGHESDSVANNEELYVEAGKMVDAWWMVVESSTFKHEALTWIHAQHYTGPNMSRSMRYDIPHIAWDYTGLDPDELITRFPNELQHVFQEKREQEKRQSEINEGLRRLPMVKL